MRYRVLILLLILGCSMDLAPDNGKTDFIYSALEIIYRIFSVLDVLFNFKPRRGGGKYSARKKRQTGAILVMIFFFRMKNVSIYLSGFS